MFKAMTNSTTEVTRELKSVVDSKLVTVSEDFRTFSIFDEGPEAGIQLFLSKLGTQPSSQDLTTQREDEQAVAFALGMVAQSIPDGSCTG